MRFRLSGSNLEVNFTPIPQCISSHGDSGGDGVCVVVVNTWRQAWLLYCTLVQCLVAVVTLFSKGVKIATSQVREMMRRFDVAAESVMLRVGGADWRSVSVCGMVALALGCLAIASLFVERLAGFRSALCDGCVVATCVAFVFPTGGGAVVADDVFARCGNAIGGAGGPLAGVGGDMLSDSAITGGVGVNEKQQQQQQPMVNGQQQQQKLMVNEQRQQQQQPMVNEQQQQ
jgi:hypothetical protein